MPWVSAIEELDRFGDVVVISRAQTPQGKSGKRGPYFLCECLRCGNTAYIATSGDLRSGRITSCGCYRNSQEFADKKCVHGNRRQKKGITTAAYVSWIEMKKRCDNPQANNYPWYGGKGIKYDPNWKWFKNFLRDMGDTEPGMTLDRKDSTKDYCKDNCRWLTKSENSQRKSFDSGTEL